MIALQDLIKQAGYSVDTFEHFPKTEQAEVKVAKLEQLIKEAGYTPQKANESEYTYEYEIGDEIVVFNYRMGDTGLSAWWS